MSGPIIPSSFFFRYTFHIPFVSSIPSTGKRLIDLPAKAEIPCPATMDGAPQFAVLRMGWNEFGIGLVLEVLGNEKPVRTDTSKWTDSDGLSIWIDTRDSRSSQRAGRFCQRFLLLPDDGSGKGVPQARRHPIKRALEESPAVDESTIRIVCKAIDEDGDEIPAARVRAIKNYRLEVFLPHTVLHGFDPENNRRLGFFYRVRNHDVGDQILSGAPEMPYWENPSLWSTLQLDSLRSKNSASSTRKRSRSAP
ncbi:hypothetical protein K2X85_15425 [bacterium]|nr:hypothetical protein [bacterium]